MKLKLDENLSRHLKPILMNLGHDVVTAFVQSADLNQLVSCVAIVEPVRVHVRFPEK
jgi:hypothetical protein